LLAPNVPNARDGVAVLTLTEGGATTTVVEFNKGIDTLVITTNQASNRTSRETFGARGNAARAEFTLLEADIKTLAMTTTLVVVVAALSSLAVILVIVAVGFSGSLGRSRGLGSCGSGWGFVAAEGTGRPVPALRALGRREGIGWLVRSTAALSGVPRPVERTVSIGRWLGGFAGTS